MVVSNDRVCSFPATHLSDYIALLRTRHDLGSLNSTAVAPASHRPVWGVPSDLPGVQHMMKQDILSALLLCILAAVVANAAKMEQQDYLLQEPGKQLHRNQLMTYYFDVSKPQLELSAAGSGRPGRTALTVKLAKPSLSQFMPVVSTSEAGMTHQVAKTWETLKVCSGGIGRFLFSCMVQSLLNCQFNCHNITASCCACCCVFQLYRISPRCLSTSMP